MDDTFGPNNKPATPLPWEVNGFDVYAGETPVLYVRAPEEVPNMKRARANVDYAAHAANAYPKLVEFLMTVNGTAKERELVDLAGHLMQELGEAE